MPCRSRPCRPGTSRAAARRRLPILSRTVHGKRLVYLDNGATTQKPDAVIEAERNFYRDSNANIHRGVHWLSQHATDLYEDARKTVQRFINADKADEIVFPRHHRAINLVAQSWGRTTLEPGDEILVTTLEHHSNIVPWQLLCEQTGAVLKVAPISDAGELDLEAFEGAARPTHPTGRHHPCIERAGHGQPVARLVEQAHAAGAIVLVDGARAVAHQAVDDAGTGLRFLRLLGPQALRPDRHRRALRSRRAAPGDAAVAWRRRHDPHRELRAQHLRRRTPALRGRYAQHRRRGRAGRGDRLRIGCRHGQHRSHEHALLGHATAALQTVRACA